MPPPQTRHTAAAPWRRRSRGATARLVGSSGQALARRMRRAKTGRATGRCAAPNERVPTAPCRAARAGAGARTVHARAAAARCARGCARRAVLLGAPEALVACAGAPRWLQGGVRKWARPARVNCAPRSAPLWLLALVCKAARWRCAAGARLRAPRRAPHATRTQPLAASRRRRRLVPPPRHVARRRRRRVAHRRRCARCRPGRRRWCRATT